MESIGSYAFAYSALTSIRIPETVKTIGNRAFDSCKNLTNITVEPENTVYKSDGNCLIRITDNVLLKGCKNSVIPNYITIIGEGAFSNISNLTSITIPYGVEEIGDYAFSYCSSLTSVILPSSVTAIGKDAFYYCSNLSEIELPDSVISLGEYAFALCKNLIEVTLPDNLIVLKKNTFYECSALSNIVISENLETIENYAFSGCYKLTVINIPKNVISIGNSAFYDCRNLTAINVDSQNSAYSSVDGVLYDKSQTVLICYPVKKSGEIAMQSGITEIGSYAFFGNGMTQIIIPASVTIIGDYAFSGCGDLTGVYFESGSMLIDLGEGAFEGCLNLTGIILPSGVTELSSNLFAYCENMLYVGFNGICYLEIISDTAFYGCYNLFAFRIPETVTSIGNDAFGECYSIADITIPSAVMYVGANAFSGWSSEQTIRVSSEEIAYGYWDYYWSDNCEAQIVWEEAIVDYSYGFDYNYIEDEEGNYGWEISAGSGFIRELNYVVIPAYFEGIPVIKVADYGFYNCANLTKVYFETGSLTSIGDYAFAECYNLIEISIPAGVTYIGTGAFQNCGCLQRIKIPESVAYIGCGAFGWCYDLKSITIASVTAYIELDIVDSVYGFTLYTDAESELENWQFLNSSDFTIFWGCTLSEDKSYVMSIEPANIYFNSDEIYAPHREGYIFLGWATTPDGIPQYSMEELYELSSSEEITLYAVWLMI